MFERNSRRIQSSATSSSNSSKVNIGADLSGDQVFLSGRVVPSVSFARAMTTLGRVVRLSAPGKKDRSAYQIWVQQKYFEELEQITPNIDKKIASQNARLANLQAKAARLNSEISAISKANLFIGPRTNFWNWLYNVNRDAWFVLDPIVSVQKDGTFFEAFSMDESVYARVFLPHSALEADKAPSYGTTNIDYGVLLDREFMRTRTYRPLNLQVGMDSVEISSSGAKAIEERIPLPETWVQGLVEVQSVMSLAQTSFTITSDSLADIIARLESQKDTMSPRSLKFHLSPGKPIRIEIEPWNEFYRDEKNLFHGESDQVIRIWGRRRLRILKELLVHSDQVKVLLLGSGMPSFWTVIQNGIELTIGLSGWTSNDWSSKAKFSAFLPTIDIKADDSYSAKEILSTKGTLTSKDLSKELGMNIQYSSSILQSLCLSGKAMFDPERSIYRWRDLFPYLDLVANSAKSPEEVAGFEMSKSNEFSLKSDELKDSTRFVSGKFEDSLHSFEPRIEFDLDGRPKYADCTCPFFRFNKLKAGPCRHLIATTLKVGEL